MWLWGSFVFLSLCFAIYGVLYAGIKRSEFISVFFGAMVVFWFIKSLLEPNQYNSKQSYSTNEVSETYDYETHDIEQDWDRQGSYEN